MILNDANLLWTGKRFIRLYPAGKSTRPLQKKEVEKK
jgi:hypothetical protein